MIWYTIHHMEKAPFPSAKRIIIISVLVDISDIILSLFVAVVSGSIVMAVEVLEGISDLVASGALLIGHYRSKTPADKQFPFGYGRELYFWTFISAVVIIGVTSTFSIYFGWQRVLHPRPLHNLNLAYGVLILTACTNLYAFLLSLKRLRARTHRRGIIKTFFRSSLIETKTTFVLDLMGTVASVFGFTSLLFYQLTGDFRFDGFGAITVGLVLAALGILLILGIRDLLIGKSASQETVDQIRKISLTIPEVSRVIEVKTMHIGSERLLVNMDVSMKKNLTTYQIAKLIDDIEAKIKKGIPMVKHIHLELELP